MASTIGIKIANGEFYSIVEENSQVKKRLVLTTVHDNQHSVQIDLYKSFVKTMADAFYIGSLVLENIKPRPKGEPSIELIISSARNGNITADAVDLDVSAKGGRQTLTVSLKSLEEDNRELDLPDFELEHNEPPPTGLYEKAAEISDGEGKKGFPWLVIILAALVLTAIALVVWLYFFQWGGNRASASASSVPAAQTQSAPQAQSAAQTQPTAQPETPAAQAQPAAQPPAQAQPEAPAAQSAAQPSAQPVAQPTAQPAAQAAPPPQQAPPPVIQAPAQAPSNAAQVNRDRPAAPVASFNVPSVIPAEGVPYRIRYGDTLWDIAEAFYRNPWLYPRIARFNNIRNPDLIISGTTILVPPRN